MALSNIELSVLIVDDDQDFADSLSDLLESNSYQVECAYTASSAKRKIQQFPAYVALLDVKLGRESGVNLIQALRQINPYILCVMVTAYAAVDTALEALRMGAYDYLNKPLHPDEVLATLKRCFEHVSLDLRQEAMRKALWQEKEKAQITLSSIADAVITVDTAGKVEYLNPAAETMTGWSLANAQGQAIQNVFHIINDLTKELASDPVQRCLAEDRIVGLPENTVLIQRGGKQIAVEDSVAPIRNADGFTVGAVLVFHDVTQARTLAKQISYQATHDSLTGLINRGEFERRVERALESVYDGASISHTLIYIDLDQFKVVNDTCGHMVGDELLKQLTAILRTKIRQEDTLARLGGDEFGVLLQYCSLAQANQVANKLLQSIQDYRFIWRQRSFAISASIGLVSISQQSYSFASLLSQADAACYAAKDAGRNRIHVYRQDDKELQRRHGEMEWVSKITQAFEEKRLCLYHQAIVALDTDTEKHQHFEILIRMFDENQDLVLPGAFIPSAERYNLMPILDRWVVRTTFHYLSLPNVDLEQIDLCSINLSGHTLGDEYFQEFLVEQLANCQIPPEKICFEITETAAIGNLNQAMHLISEMKKVGCRFALDDFGSGLSSFAYLKNLNVDYLKIDGYFVKDIAEDPVDYAMVKSINEVGHIMGLKTIAEFVDSELVLEKLKAIGVDYVQGFGIGKPKPLDKICERN